MKTNERDECEYDPDGRGERVLRVLSPGFDRVGFLTGTQAMANRLTHPFRGTVRSYAQRVADSHVGLGVGRWFAWGGVGKELWVARKLVGASFFDENPDNTRVARSVAGAFELINEAEKRCLR